MRPDDTRCKCSAASSVFAWGVEMSLDQPLNSQSSASLEEREAQLADAIALGNALLQERDELERQLQCQTAREVELIAQHRQEVRALMDQLSRASQDLEQAQTELHDARDDAAGNAETMQSLREELAQARSANHSLIEETQQQEERQETMRRQSVIAHDLTDENDALKARIADLEQQQLIAKQSVATIRAERDTEVATAHSEVAEWRSRCRELQGQLDVAKRDTEDAKTRNRGPSVALVAPRSSRSFNTNNTSSHSPSSPSHDGGDLDDEYTALATRARGRSQVHFSYEPAAATVEHVAVVDDEPQHRTSFVRHRRNESEDDSYEMTVRARAVSTHRKQAPSVAATPAPEAVAPSPAQKAPTANEVCGLCGREPYPPPQRKGGCPCVVA